MRKMIFVAVCLWLMGCSNEKPRDCGYPSGLYSNEYKEVSGDCGPSDPDVSAFDPIGHNDTTDQDTGMHCVSDVIGSEDMCHTEETGRCELADGTVAMVNVAYEFYDGGRYAEGRMTSTFLRNGQVVCHSTYDVTSRKQ